MSGTPGYVDEVGWWILGLCIVIGMVHCVHSDEKPLFIRNGKLPEYAWKNYWTLCHGHEKDSILRQWISSNHNEVVSME